MTDQIENQQEKLSAIFIADNMAHMARNAEGCSIAFGFDWQQELCANALRLLEEYDGVLRELCSYLAVGGYNSDGLIDPQTADSKIRDGIDHILKVEKSRAIPEGHVVVPGWMPIESAPQNRACLIHYRNICNRDRVIKAKYVSARTIEANEDWPDEACDMDDETETAYIPAGWYEMIDNHDDCSLIGVSSSVKITGWMPLPAAPANKEG